MKVIASGAIGLVLFALMVGGIAISRSEPELLPLPRPGDNTQKSAITVQGVQGNPEAGHLALDKLSNDTGSGNAMVPLPGKSNTPTSISSSATEKVGAESQSSGLERANGTGAARKVLRGSEMAAEVADALILAGYGEGEVNSSDLRGTLMISGSFIKPLYDNIDIPLRQAELMALQDFHDAYRIWIAEYQESNVLTDHGEESAAKRLAMDRAWSSVQDACLRFPRHILADLNEEQLRHYVPSLAPTTDEGW